MKANGEIAKIQADIGVLRYPISATGAEKPLPRKGRESFPSWTSSVHQRRASLEAGDLKDRMRLRARKTLDFMSRQPRKSC